MVRKGFFGKLYLNFTGKLYLNFTLNHVKEDLGKNILNTCGAKALKQGNIDVLVRKK